MTTDIDLQNAQYYDEMNQVVTALIKGETNPTALARELGMTRKKVLDYMDEWQRISRQHPDVQGKAMEALTAMDQHYNMIIKEMWVIVDTEAENKVRATVLKNLADIEAKRQETWQKSGLMSDDSMGDQIAEMEETAQAIKQLLSDVAKKYPDTRLFIMEGIQRVFGHGVAVPTDDNTVIKGEIEN